jgi:hypothetical protein
MNETWTKEMERSVGYLIKAVDDLVHSDAVNRQAEEVIRSVALARETLGAAIDSLSIDDPS